jgi:RNA polymerase sigma-70 factor (ECF subfamily)
VTTVSVDIPRIVALLSDDVLLTMPPMGVRIEGAGAVGEFFASEPMDGRLDRITLKVTRANRQPALAGYADRDAYGVMVFGMRGERIAGITGFPHDLEVFGQLGLPARATSG